MGDVVTGKVETESMMQQSPGICKVLAVKREQANVKGNGCPLASDLQADVHPETAHSWDCTAGLLWHPAFACALSCNVDVLPLWPKHWLSARGLPCFFSVTGC